MDDQLIVKPKPIKGFFHNRVIYIPCDTPSRIIQKKLNANASKEKNLAFATLYSLRNSTVLYNVIGASAAVVALECLIASGAEEIILLGFCGALGPLGNIAEATSISLAYSEEGTSKHYFPRKKLFRPSSTLKNALESVLIDQKLNFHEGVIVSTDAPFRETQSWLSEKRKKQIDFVDMETSAVFALAEFYKINATALMIISDKLESKSWTTGFRKLLFSKQIRRYFFPFITKNV